LRTSLDADASPLASDCIRRSEARLRSSDGLALFRREWLPPEPSRALLVVHGLGEHSGRYLELASWFATRGAVVHAYDQRGHGHSAGRRAHVDCFAKYVSDLRAVLEFSSSQHPDLPLTIIGHSMGAVVVAQLAREGASGVDGIILSGAALAAHEKVSARRTALIRLLRRIVPKLLFDAGIDPEGLSRDASVAARYREDPQVLKRITTTLGAEFLDAAAFAAGGAGEVELPVLLLHGGADPICPPSGSEAYFARLPSDRVAGCELHILPGLRHEIFNEPEREAVFEQMQRWLLRREQESASGAPRAGEGVVGG
jgi:alpha-beta hydrolase superfamily lysophospholipase